MLLPFCPSDSFISFQAAKGSKSSCCNLWVVEMKQIRYHKYITSNRHIGDCKSVCSAYPLLVCICLDKLIESASTILFSMIPKREAKGASRFGLGIGCSTRAIVVDRGNLASWDFWCLRVLPGLSCRWLLVVCHLATRTPILRNANSRNLNDDATP